MLQVRYRARGSGAAVDLNDQVAGFRSPTVPYLELLGMGAATALTLLGLLWLARRFVLERQIVAWGAIAGVVVSAVISGTMIQLPLPHELAVTIDPLPLKWWVIGSLSPSASTLAGIALVFALSAGKGPAQGAESRGASQS